MISTTITTTIIIIIIIIKIKSAIKLHQKERHHKLATSLSTAVSG